MIPLRRIALALTVLAACGDEAPPEEKLPAWSAAFDASDSGWLMNVWAADGEHVLVAGGTPDAGRLLSFDGTTWADVDLGLDVPLLDWIHGFGARDVTVVGFGGTILHFDGTTWSREESPTTENLWGVWGATPGDLWAVGGGGSSGDVPTVLHRESAGWVAVPLPELQKPNVHAFYKVWGTGPSDVWIVGQRGAVLHWDGEALAEVLVGASDDIVSLWGAAGHILAVGGRGNAQLSTFDGTSWKTTVEGLPGLNGVWTGDGITFHVAGADGTLLDVDFASRRWERTAIQTGDDFHSVFGVDGTLFAVGGSLGSLSPPYRGLAYRRALEPRE
jgi:hypothetical protein